MEINGAAYLYALAATAMAFLGFSVVVVILRQTLGASLSRFQTLLMQLFIEHAFVAAFLALLPLLLALFAISHELIWRICSAFAGIFIACWMSYFVARRYPVATSKPHTSQAWLNYGISFLIVVALLANAAGFPYHPQVGIYAVGVSWVLLQGIDIFIISLKGFLRTERRKTD